ncbi:hypothetical protein B0J18DRAFT_430627 [Chaetomium sp. MPI-SDFR-AT-0129]|nr:hypothetical protein B0J18DRAFT_430627 [Chaetomium sp. MPI-SDFR-AT-0129]
MEKRGSLVHDFHALFMLLIFFFLAWGGCVLAASFSRSLLLLLSLFGLYPGPSSSLWVAGRIGVFTLPVYGRGCLSICLFVCPCFWGVGSVASSVIGVLRSGVVWMQVVAFAVLF